MRLNDLKPDEGSRRSRKRVGRGHGSGHVKTAGRGTKGQNSRSGGRVRPGFEGGQNPIYQRMPYKRGFKNPFPTRYELVNLQRLESLDVDSPVTPELLHEQRVIRSASARVKILADGELTKNLTVCAHKFSSEARRKIEAAGGSIEVID